MKYDLPFTLLVDSDHAIAERYGVWGGRNRCTARSNGHRPKSLRHR
jgi:peroxiredoxin